MARKPTPRIENGPHGIRTGPSTVSESAKPFAIQSSSADINRLLELYNPEAEAQVKKIPYEKFAESMAVPRTKDGKPTQISGRFVLPGAGARGRTITREAIGWANFDKLRASDAWKRGKLREAYGFAPNLAARMVKAYGAGKLKEAFDGFGMGEPTDSVFGTASPNDEYRPIMLGPFSRQLYLYDMLDMQSKAFESWNHHPIARAVVNLMCHFVLGDGPKVKWRSPQLQDRWDAWTLATKWDEKTRLWFRDCSILGETFLHDPGSLMGAPSMTLFDASTVWEIMTNPRNIDDVYYLHRQFPTQYQVPYGSGPTIGKPGGESAGNLPISEYVIEQFPPSEWLQVKLNATIGEKRGRSDLFAVLGWLKRFRDWFNAAVVKAQISNAFVVWWNINGNDGDIQAFKNNQDFKTLPPPGSMWFTNNAAVPNLLTAETSGINAADKTGEQLLAIIATSLNLPPEFLGVSGGATRATALKRGEPAGKIFEARQQLVREVITWQARRFAAAMIGGGHVDTTVVARSSRSRIINLIRSGADTDLTKAAALIEALRGKEEVREPIDEAFAIIMPAIETQDRTIYLRDLTTARATGVYSKEAYATRVAEALDDHEYDFDEQQELIASEEARGISSAPGTMPGGRAPGQPGAAGTPAGGPEDAPAKPGSSDDNRRYEDAANGRPAKR